MYRLSRLKSVMALTALLSTGIAVGPAVATTTPVYTGSSTSYFSANHTLIGGSASNFKAMDLTYGGVVKVLKDVAGVATETEISFTCTASDISVDSKYLWALCPSVKTVARVLLTDYTQIDYVTIPATIASGAPQCYLGDVWSDGTYFAVNDYWGATFVGPAEFPTGTSPTVTAGSSTVAPYFCGSDGVQPLVTPTKTYNFHIEGMLAPITNSATDASEGSQLTYLSSNALAGVSLAGSQLWVHPSGTTKLLNYAPNDLTTPATTLTLSSTTVSGLAYDGTFLWVSENGVTVDGRDPSNGALKVQFDYPTSATAAFRVGDEQFLYLGGYWYTKTVPAVFGTAPGAPTNAAVTSRGTSVTVTWRAPSNVGSAAISGYTATVYVGTLALGTCTVSGAARSCTISLPGSYGQSLTASVVATNSAGSSPSSTKTATFTTGGINILFASGTMAISASAQAEIKAWAKGACPNSSCTLPLVTVDGYADTQGTKAQNLQLSKARANAVAAAMKVEIGKLTRRPLSITVVGHGATSQFSKTDLAKNRRVVVSSNFLVG